MPVISNRIVSFVKFYNQQKFLVAVVSSFVNGSKVPRRSKYPLSTCHNRCEPSSYKTGKRNNLQSKSMSVTVFPKQKQNWYETHQAAFGPEEGCIGKLDRYNGRRICEKWVVKETFRNPCNTTLFGSGLFQFSSKNQTWNKPLYYIESMDLTHRNISHIYTCVCSKQLYVFLSVS
jgi:hypothetical protein